MTSRSKPPRPRRRARGAVRADSPVATRTVWASFGIALVVVALLVAAHPHTGAVQVHPLFAAGEVSDREVIATLDFVVERDAQTMAAERRAARSAAPVVLVHRESVEIERRAVLDAFYDDLDGGQSDALELSRRWSFGLSGEELARFSGPSSSAKRLRRQVDRLVERLFDHGVADAHFDRADRPAVIQRAGREMAVDGAEVIRADRWVNEVANWVAQLTSDPDEQHLVATLVSAIVEPNLILDEEESGRRARAAEAEISRTIAGVRRGERIVRAHEVVTSLQAKKLIAFRNATTGPSASAALLDRLHGILVHAGVFALLISCVGAYVWRYRPDIAGDLKKEILVGILILIAALPSATVVAAGFLEDVAAPVMIGAVLATILLDAHVAIVLAVVTVFVVASYSAGSALFSLTALIVSLATIFALENIRKRSSYYRSILAVIGVGVVTVVFADQVYGVALERTFERVIGQSGAILISFMVSLFLLPAFERFFGLTTDLTLNEYSDLNHPLLRQLAVRAPGSFHHSMMMANLAEAAATSIDANPLLARVGAYYHDVGKMSKSEYFIENQFGSVNKHDQLAPSMSVLVIQNHIKEGIEMAKQNRLPQAIIDFIPEHHGTSVISYFYNKAVSATSLGEVRMDDYRYPGPKPHSRETAIVMIADTVVAASRSLDDPTPLKLGQMVQKSIRDKFLNGQLDNSGLTLDDLRRIGEAFSPILNGAFHQRVAYPETEEQRMKEPSRAPSKRGQDRRGGEDDSDMAERGVS